jgi:hypothetical protein
MKTALVIKIAMCVLALALSTGSAMAQGKPLAAQDFEKDGDGPAFTPVWNCIGEVQTQKAQGGKQALRMQVAQDGGTIAVHFPKQSVDFSKAKKITLWIFDEQGENNVELRIKDVHGNGGSGMDGKAMWSEAKSRHKAWTKIEWDLRNYPAVEGLDKTQIRSLEIYEYLPGAYYIDDVTVE